MSALSSERDADSPGLVFWLATALLASVSILPLVKLDYMIVDLAETIYHVKELAIGRVPYRDIFSHHFLGYLLPFLLVELITPINGKVIWGLCFLFHIFNCVMAYLVVRRLTTTENGRVAALLMATVGWFWGWSGVTFNNQSYIVPILFLFLLCLVESLFSPSRSRWWQTSCLVFSMLVSFDQRLIIFSPLLLLPISFDVSLRKIRTIAIGAALLITPWLILLAYLLYNKAFSDFIFQTVIYPFEYRNFGLAESFWARTRGLLSLGLKGAGLELSFAAFGLILYINSQKDRKSAYLLSSFFFLSLIYVFLGGREFLHYWYLMAPITIVGLSLLTLGGKFWRVIGNLAQLAVIILALFRPIGWLMFSPDPFMKGNEGLHHAVGDFIKSNTGPDDRMIVWGYFPQIYLSAERFSPFRDMGLISVAGANYRSSLLQDQRIVPDMDRDFKAMLSSHPPKVFVYARSRDKIPPRKPGTIRFGMGPEKNFSLDKASHLFYVKDLLTSRYSLQKEFSDETTLVSVYLLK